MYWHDRAPVGAWLAMGFMMLLFTALVIALVVWVVRGSAHHSPARHLLDERFARGEISEEEYRTRRALLDQWR